MNTVSHGLCVSSHSWTPEDREIAQRRIPLKVQAEYVTQDLCDFSNMCASITVAGGARRHVATRVWLVEHEEREKALIAAAPHLLDALRLTVAALEGKPCRQQALDDARRAISKTEVWQS